MSSPADRITAIPMGAPAPQQTRLDFSVSASLLMLALVLAIFGISILNWLVEEVIFTQSIELRAYALLLCLQFVAGQVLGRAKISIFTMRAYSYIAAFTIILLWNDTMADFMGKAWNADALPLVMWLIVGGAGVFLGAQHTIIATSHVGFLITTLILVAIAPVLLGHIDTERGFATSALIISLMSSLAICIPFTYGRVVAPKK